MTDLVTGMFRQARPMSRARTAILLLVTLALGVAFGAGIMSASALHDTTSIHACVDKSKGDARIVADAQACNAKKEYAIEWNKQGIQGEQGLQGEQGIQGEQGPIGPEGPAGPQGLKGDTGEAGPQGPKGDTGDVGPAGPQGLKGDTGAAGATGPAGAAGPAGPAGPQGIQGPSGLAGLEWVTVTRNYGTFEYFTTVDATCPAGKVALSGGYDKSVDSTKIHRSMPILNGSGVATGWRVYGDMPELSVHGDWSVTSYVLCGNPS